MASVRSLLTQLVRCAVLFLLLGGIANAADTEPSLALMRVTASQSTAGRISLTLEGSLSFANALQLALPLQIIVTQGSLSGRFDLAGNVFTSVGGGAEQPAPGPGVIAVSQRQIVLVLPVGFAAGDATAQIVGTYEGSPIASNRLRFTI